MLAAVLGYRLPAFNRSTLSEILLAISSASAAASVRYCASLWAAIAAPPIATSPSTPSEKIRIAISASMRKKPPWCAALVPSGVVLFGCTAGSSAGPGVAGRGHGIAQADLAAGRHAHAPAAHRPGRRAQAAARIRDVQLLGGAIGGGADAVEGDGVARRQHLQAAGVTTLEAGLRFDQRVRLRSGGRSPCTHDPVVTTGVRRGDVLDVPDVDRGVGEDEF